jgi:toxin ParE1/3/4
MLQCVSGQHVRSLAGLRVTGFERRVTIAFIVTADAVLIEGIFYGGRDFEAHFRDRT